MPKGTSTEEQPRQWGEGERDSRAIVDGIPGFVAILGTDGLVQVVNRRILDYCGQSLEQLRNWGTNGTVHPDDMPHVADIFGKSMLAGTPYYIEQRLRRFDGSYRWFGNSGIPAKDDAGNILHWYVLLTDVDERRKAEQALRAREIDLRLIIDTIPGLICLFAPDGQLEGANQQFLDYLQQTFEEARHWATNGNVHPDDLPTSMNAFLHSIATGEPYDFESRVRRFDGVYRWFQIRGQAHRDAEGRVVRWYGLLIDIDDRKRAERALEVSERNLRLTIDTIPALAWSANADGTGDFFNQHYLDYVGESRDQVRDWQWTRVVHPDDLGIIHHAWESFRIAGVGGEVEARIRRHDGVYRWFLFRTSPLRDEQGNIVKWFGVNADIEDRKRAETLLAGEKQLLEMVASGRSLRDVLGALCKVVEGVAHECYCDVELIDRSGFAWPIRGHVLKDTMKLVSSTPIRSRAGDVLATLCMYQREPANSTSDHQDIIDRATQIASIAIERLQAEEELRRREHYLAAGERVSLTGSFAWQVSTGKITCSEQLLRIQELGDPSEVSIETIRARIHPDDLALLETTAADAASGEGNPDYEIRLLMPDGRIKYVRVSFQVVYGAEGQLEYIGAVQDVTRRRLAEDALDKVRSDLMHLTRSMSLGTLTASIAHEVNQPLAGIVTNASTCVRMLSADPPNVAGALEISRRNIRDSKRAADVISRLRALFARNTTRSAQIDLNEAATEVITLMSSDLQRNRVLVQTELAPNLPRITADRVQLQQVLLNLLRNASDAMNNVHDRSRLVVIRTMRDGDEHVRLMVQDSGVGFASEHAEAMFQAFYTTKSAGMGIGLSVSRTIIESHNGQLWAECDAGGATFAFRIPVTPAPVPA
ncbi:MAG TPA: PAS domain-containing protein [Steroidobacter sp.]